MMLLAYVEISMFVMQNYTTGEHSWLIFIFWFSIFSTNNYFRCRNWDDV